MKGRKFYFRIVMLTLFLLAGCQGRGSASADQAAVQQILRSPANGAVVDPTSFKVLQTQAFESSSYIVLSYNRTWNNRDETCLAMHETHYELLTGWVAGSGAGACSDRRAEGQAVKDPMHLSGGTQIRKDQQKSDLSHVLGAANDPAITRVRITWQDGQMQEAKVVNGSFLAMRTGKVELKTAEGFNQENALVYVVAH
jgi:hypothetical protein